MSKKFNRPRRIYGCLDFETTNDLKNRNSFCVSYQLSVLKDLNIDIRSITPYNLHNKITTQIFRDFSDLCNKLDFITKIAEYNKIIPVIMVHNLSFEIVPLSSYLNNKKVRSISKSKTNPLVVNVYDENDNIVLVFWDTQSFFGKSLYKCGEECGYNKGTGWWDYLKYRTNKTPLTMEELEYARRDVEIPFVYLAYYLRRNPEIIEKDLSSRIVTKTSVVRYKSQKRASKERDKSGNTMWGYWMKRNKSQKPKTDDELFTIHAGTRGAMVYCASSHAGKIFSNNDGYRILQYDANSMHIFHAISHRVPVDYHKASEEIMLNALISSMSITYEDILRNYHNPFKEYFYGKFKFTNVSVKKDSVFYKHGITSFSANRFVVDIDYSEYRKFSNEGGIEFDKNMKSLGYTDKASKDAIFEMSKLVSASEVTLYLNELSSWEFFQQYDFDSIESYEGYITNKTSLPTFKSLMSFNEFYRRKDLFKKLKNKYNDGEFINSNEIPSWVPYEIRGILLSKNRSVSGSNEIDSYYYFLKSEVNSLYGIEITNEAKNRINISKDGFILEKSNGVESLPKVCKTWYQYGSHIVGWSRIHQMLFIYLTEGYVDAYICGDTDSHKIYTKYSQDKIESLLSKLNSSVDMAYNICTKGARNKYDWYPMNGVGYYEKEEESDKFYAFQNKMYASLKDSNIKLTIAGVPCDMKLQKANGEIVDHSLTRIANLLYENGYSFGDICTTILSFNVIIDSNVTGTNERIYPKWGEIDEETGQPKSILLVPSDRVIGDMLSEENACNFSILKDNNEDIDDRLVYIGWGYDDESPTVKYIDIFD